MIDFRRLGAVTEVASGRRCPPDALRAEVARRAGALARAGVGPGDRVLCTHANTAAALADLLAAWARGACAALLHPGAAPGEVDTVIGFLRPRAVLTGADGPPADPGPGVVCLDAGAAPGPPMDLPARPPLTGDAPALVLFTSGTTGAPKAVVLSAGALAHRLAANRAEIGDAALGRTLCLLPTHFGHGLIGNCLTPLAAGAHLFLAAHGGIARAMRLGEIIDRHRIGFASSVPASWNLTLEASPAPAGGTLRRLHVGSAPLGAARWRAIAAWAGGAEVVNAYGLTETANWAAGASSAEFEPEDGLVGRPWGGEAGVGAPGEAPRAEGEGEICLRSPALMSGYLGRAAATRAVLAGGWYRTGDVGRIDAHGVIRLTGRLRTEINRAGAKVHPEEIDLVVEAHPGVVAACTFGVPDPAAGEAVACAVRVAPGGPDATALGEWCAARIRAECVPEKWFTLAEIPRTERGKIDRAAVRARCLEE